MRDAANHDGVSQTVVSNLWNVGPIDSATVSHSIWQADSYTGLQFSFKHTQ